ncbi:MAG: lysine--tRNA ligase [Thermoplasmata archaeon]
MHWVDVIARELLRRGVEHVVASGTSISGQIHIGNAGDVIIADGVARAVREIGGRARLIWIADDADPLRRLPKQLPAEFDAHLGKPCYSLPCPEGHPHSFVEHYVEPFVASLARLGVRPEVRSGAEMYRKGEYEALTRVALERGDTIRRILRDISGTEKASDWLPFEPVCERCGKIATTHAYAYRGDKVLYRCSGGVAGKMRIEGCGYEGEADLRNGKLSWRVEWAARWKILGVTCEPFGKEHAASGGSYDTSSVISREVFGYEPPKPVIYEHILVGGRKMSKSLGNILTVEQFLEVAPPEVLRFFFFRTRATRHKDFDISRNLLHLVEDYEHIERVYYGVDKPSPQEDAGDLKRSYELSQIDKPAQTFFQVPYTHLVTIVQLAPDFEGVKGILARNRQLDGLDDFWERKLAEKVGCVRAWVEKYAPEEHRFVLQRTVPAVRLDDAEKGLLAGLAVELSTVPWEAERIHNAIHEKGKAMGLDAARTFGAVYKVMLGKERGPRMGYFLQSLDRDWVVGRLRAAGRGLT